MILSTEENYRYTSVSLVAATSLAFFLEEKKIINKKNKELSSFPREIVF